METKRDRCWLTYMFSERAEAKKKTGLGHPLDRELAKKELLKYDRMIRRALEEGARFDK